MLFRHFFNVIIYVKIVGKICPILSTRIWSLFPGLENNHTFKCWSGIFPTIWTYMIMLKNGQNNISVYGFSPIRGKNFYSCLNFMKPGSQSGTKLFEKIGMCQIQSEIYHTWDNTSPLWYIIIFFICCQELLE